MPTRTVNSVISMNRFINDKLRQTSKETGIPMSKIIQFALINHLNLKEEFEVELAKCLAKPNVEEE